MSGRPEQVFRPPAQLVNVRTRAKLRHNVSFMRRRSAGHAKEIVGSDNDCAAEEVDSVLPANPKAPSHAHDQP